MILIETKNYREMSRFAAGILLNEILKKPKISVGFATGETFLGFYRELVKFYKTGKVSFLRVVSFNLDEYYPIKRWNKKSLYYYMKKNFFSKVDIKESNINFLNGEVIDWKRECEDYEKKIKNKPIDIQFLGVGVNGHIAFNEPGSLANSKTRKVRLSDLTKKINKVENSYALTMGVSTIMKSRKIILVASGEEKAKAIYHLVKGKISKNWPVSYLRNHKNLIVVFDEKAGKFL